MRLGLIGTAIAHSRMPMLQRLAAARTGQALSYELHDLAGAAAPSFDQAFDGCRDAGYRGINVTHPFKAVAARRVSIDDPLVRAMGAVNTVLFGSDGRARGVNTDYSGFLRAWRRRFGERPPGTVAVVGTGGVGRAIAFALAALGAVEIRLFDIDVPKSRALADALAGIGIDTAIVVAQTVEEAVANADGLINGTPVGMHYKPGCPVPEDCIEGRDWVFDAVYTPMKTELLTLAETRGIATLSGFALFLGQGVDAFEAFTGVRLADEDVAAIERELLADLARAP